MPVRRTLFAFLVTFACALAVFTLPRFVSNTILGATTQSQSKDTVPAATTTQAPAARRGGWRRGRWRCGCVACWAWWPSRDRLRPLEQPQAHTAGAWWPGPGAAAERFAVFVLRIPVGQWLFSKLGAAVTWLLSFSYAGSSFVFGEIGKQQLEHRRRVRVPGLAGDHFRVGAVRDPLLPRRHAARGQGIRDPDEQGDGRERRRELERRRLDLHGADSRRRSPSGRSCRP